MSTVVNLLSGESQTPSSLFLLLQLNFNTRAFCRYIEYALRGDADEAVRKLNGTELNGVVVSVAEDVSQFAVVVSRL